jgi:hypothetical protein
MLRITVIICFTLTLLCPVFCLARTGDECSAQEQPMSENCEAMTFGAVVEQPNNGIASPHQLLPSVDGLSLSEPTAVGPTGRAQSTLRHHSHAKSPPDAARRQAFLQTFLF